MGIEFLGNKRQLESFIEQNIRMYTKECKSCLDLFSGSGSASGIFKRMGYQVYANDFLYFSMILTKAILLNSKVPAFEKINIGLTGETNDERYSQILNYLNCLEGKKGYIYLHYSPASKEIDGVERMYFTKENASKIDAIRIKIEEWKNLLTESERALLLSDLLVAVAAVSNNAGTYGCYLKHWKKKALGPLLLRKSDFVMGYDTDENNVFCKKAEDLVSEIYCDIVYADPPYTKRQYSAYYHLLETIALYDNPNIFGSTGLRDWSGKASDFCYKRKAAKALELILSRVKCKYFVMSYNNEGQMTHDKIVEIMEEYGSLTVCETFYKKYKSNNSVKENRVIERLYILEMRSD